MRVLKRTEFGNPILRDKARLVQPELIGSKDIQELIADIRHTLLEKKLGVGLAAPQVGKSLALSVIAIRPTEWRPKTKSFDLVLINPEIIEYGPKRDMYEGCISSGKGGTANLFAKVPRSTEIKVRYYDQAGKRHTQIFKGLKAQVIQHETDHLNGILFVDHVKDPKTYMTLNEYIKMVKHYLKEHPEV